MLIALVAFAACALAACARDGDSGDAACNHAPEGCTPGALYTPAVESDWLRITVEDEEQLKNTPSDCRQCHERGLPQPMLLMRELEGWLV